MVKYFWIMSRPNLPPTLRRHLDTLWDKPCWLRGYGSCNGRITAHHIIGLGYTIKSPAARKVCDMLKAPTCNAHNVGRSADTPWARRVLMLRLAEVVGEEWLETYINDIPWRKPRPELSWRGIMSASDPPGIYGC